LENNNLDAFTQDNYAKFVKTTFAYTYKKEPISTDPIQQLHHLQRLHDIVHCTYGILNEYVEYVNEFGKYGELVYKASQDYTYPTTILDAQEIVVSKEIGDIYYYKTMLFNLLGLTHNITDIQWCSEEGPHIEIIGDLIKKYVYYGHPFDIKAFEQASYDLDRCFNFICFKFNTTLPDIIAQNEAKLRKRYPSGTFTSQEAAAKADTHG
jgi:hypothetical protein